VPETKKADQSQDKASAEDAARLERDREKMQLLQELALLETQAEALDGMQKDRKQRLKLLMAGDGESARSAEDAEASFGQRRSFEVTNPEGLVMLFDTPKDAALVLAQNFKPSATFVDGLTQAGKKIQGIITVGLDETFSVSRTKTKAAKEKQRKLIEESRKTAEARIAEVVGQINKKKGTK
jgi:hypothetical protein